jgi:hypothetical protein
MTKIAFGIYNQRDRINNIKMYLRAKGSSLFYLERLSNSQNRPLRIICKDQIHDILKQASIEKFEHCVVVAAGCQIRNFNFVKELEQFISENNFGFAGHPLCKPNSWLELHHQFFIVNVKAWVEVGMPEFGEWERGFKMLPVIERSEENFHHDYTPLWIRPTGESAEQRGASQGWKLAAALMNSGWPIITLPENIRLSKFYTYPEDNTDRFLTSIETLTPFPEQNWNQDKWIKDSISVKDQIWLFNSEDMNIRNTGVYDLVINTASGFKLFDLFKNPARLSTNAKILIYDFNPIAIRWYEHFYNWKDDDLLSCIRSFPERDHFTWIGHHSSTYSEDQGFQNGLDEIWRHFGGKDFFINHWQSFKQRSVEFLEVDLYKDATGLLSIIQEYDKVWINLTNIFSTDAGQLIFGHDHCHAHQQKMLSQLYIINPEIEVTFYDVWNRTRCGTIKNIL